MKLQLHGSGVFKACQPRCSRMAHPGSEATSKLDYRKISRFIQSAYEMVPATIVMLARYQTRVVIDLAIFHRINSELSQQVKKCFRKDVLPGNAEVSAASAIARIDAATLRLAVSIDRGVTICHEFPFTKVRHDRFDALPAGANWAAFSSI